MGERVKRGELQLANGVEARNFDQRRAETVLPIIAQLLGVKSDSLAQ
jgi:hypothetical protein